LTASGITQGQAGVRKQRSAQGPERNPQCEPAKRYDGDAVHGASFVEPTEGEGRRSQTSPSQDKPGLALLKFNGFAARQNHAPALPNRSKINFLLPQIAHIGGAGP
jgi:hypothetical protein